MDRKESEESEKLILQRKTKADLKELPVTEKTCGIKEHFIMKGKEEYKKIQKVMPRTCFRTTMRVLVRKLLM